MLQRTGDRWVLPRKSMGLSAWRLLLQLTIGPHVSLRRRQVVAEVPEVPTVTLGPSPCICPDDTCQKLGCVAPKPNWWTLPTATSCDLVVDPEFGITLTGTVYAQVRECT